MQAVNKLILGDNLEILKTLDSESVDLIYLDPPFFSNRTYEVIWGDSGEVRSFEDRFSGGIDHYISWLKERVAEMYRILKITGSIFLHCDWHANAYIRTEILDRIFGHQNFRNEIIWKRAETIKGNFGQGKKSLDNNTDTIFFYSKSNTLNFQQPFKKYSEDYLEQFYKYQEPDGRKFRLISMIGPGGEAKGNPKYEFLGVTKYWRYSQTKMQELFEQGLIVQTNIGTVPQRKQYLEDGKGVAVQNLWDDVHALSASSNEAIGYPTQKPILLLKRIIEMATNENDVVFDPFVGGGTTVAVADKFNRRWVAIDQSVQAVKVTEFRLNIQQDLFSKPFIVQLHKYDYDTLRYKDAFEFESFIVMQFGGVTNTKQRGDLGLDGKTKEGSPIQVKRSDNIGRNVVDNFLSAVQRFDKKLFDKNIADQKPIGYIIAFSFGRGAVEEVARLKNKENAIIKLVTVEEIIPIAKKPTLTIAINDLGRDKKNVTEIEFKATAVSIADIEFYAWDFAYQTEKGFKPSIIIDKQGTQKHKFKAGVHNIAVKVVDKDGLDNIEIIKLKVNGTVERT